MKKAFFWGIFASAALILFYAIVVENISGKSFLINQWKTYGVFLSALSIGFGIQISLFVLIKQKHRAMSARAVTTTGTTSTAAMISCCTHYFVNVLPVIGATGVATFVAQYQIQFFWVGIFLNAFGIIYLWRQLKKTTK
ncbi:MAG: hypothetical protein UU76_C0007G0008 [Parcubacteria group bacterium GW2011_GWC1_41_7]|nr:MAG: hypothetical protein UU76_C0007G0008 [Parcubacteria group bacterium GW2011_GWC1_41_7]